MQKNRSRDCRGHGQDRSTDDLAVCLQFCQVILEDGTFGRYGFCLGFSSGVM
jgi:hypothetical protein